MGMVTRAKRRRLEEELLEDRISCLPDGVLGDIVSLLPTKDGARTQVLSSRWRPLWRAAPLNFDLQRHRVAVADVSRILAAHRGPCRRFCSPRHYVEDSERSAATLDGWLRCPALGNLEELVLHYGFPRLLSSSLPPLLPASAHRVSSTLRIAAFDNFRFPAGDEAGGALRLPVLEQLSLSFVTISESSLQALLAGCPVLQSLLLAGNNGLSRLRLVSPCLRSIGVRLSHWRHIKFQQLIIEDAPCLERLLLLGNVIREMLDISVISAPKLCTLGQLSDGFPRIKFDTTIFQGSHLVSMAAVVHSVKVLALTNRNLKLDVAINFMKCFPCLETLYIKASMAAGENPWCRKYRDLIDTLDIHLKKIVLTNYRGNKSHVNFAKFFVLNVRLLESMIFELIKVGNPSRAWIEKQHSLLQIDDRASSGARFDFVHHDKWPEPLEHRLSMEAFRFRYVAIYGVVELPKIMCSHSVLWQYIQQFLNLEFF